MRRWLPFPLLSTGLLAMWLLLNESVAPGSVILGGILALGASWALMALRPAKARVRRPGVAVRLALMVVADIVRSNIAVARIIFGVGRRDRRSGFVRIPLELRDPYGLTALNTTARRAPC